MARAAANAIASLAAQLAVIPLSQCNEGVHAAILRIRNLPDIRQNMYSAHEISADEHARWVASRINDPKSRFYCVFLDDDLIGAAGFTNIEPANSRAEWAFYLDPDTHGKGLGAALEHRMLEIAFSALGLEKLDCEVLAFNTGVLKLHKQFGFVEEGRRRARIRRGGEPIDAVMLGITRPEWETACKLRMAGSI